ncbi:fimbria/pilus outer membrane usher protein [Acinetobacter equi]|uniref:Fimbrial protein n=1 Tax=Acinetobacter equi TaxID=1324350 RepID=A0A0N9V9Z9_9GAMM|nr:fimbria/pilus outer membrane usher protein [Acinetobacter equi]ALH96153.1 hypothetical protein AOY20_11765 [Acinetobacter equi]
MNKYTYHISTIPFIFLCQTSFAESPLNEFDSNFFVGSNVSLDRFQKPGAVEPGDYEMSINLNGKYIGNSLLKIEENNHINGQSVVCANPTLILMLGIRASNEINEKNAEIDIIENNEIDTLNNKKEICIDLKKEIPYLNYNINLPELTLNVNIPQVYLNLSAQGATDSNLWEDGINAGFINYNLNYNENKNDGYGKNSNFFSMFNFGFNVGLWQFRNNSNFNYLNGKGGTWNTLNSYVQRPISSIRSNLILGESNTLGQYFDSVNFLGVQLSSDDRMLPHSLQGFAPTVRGIAQSNSIVEIRQQGNLLYKTNVPQGPFVINDLYPTGYGGELDVSVIGADGQTQTYQVPYSSISQLLRPGLSRYSVTVGELRNDTINSKPKFVQAWYSKGLSNSLTGYIGVQLAEHFQSSVTGVAFNTALGAISLDVTNSIAKINENQDKKTGWSAKIAHSKLIQTTNTYFALSAYRFSSEDYYNFSEASYLNSGLNLGFANRKDRFEVSLNQPIWAKSSLYLSGSKVNYWNGRESETYYQGGYNFGYKDINFGINVSRVERDSFESENVYSFVMNIAIQGKRNRSINNLSANYSHSHNRSQIITGMTGAVNDGSLTYSLADSYIEHQGNIISGSLTNKYSQGQAVLLASKAKDYHQYSLGVSGSVVAHSKGITLGQYSTDSLILVEADKAKGAKLANVSGVSIDRFGYGVIPYANPYRINDVTINPQGMSDSTELKVHSKKVIPYSGAIVKVKFDTVVGHKAFIYSEKIDGQHLPVGAIVKNEDGKEIGIVGQNGVIYVSGLNDQGKLKVEWSNLSEDSCLIPYHVGEGTLYEKKNGIYKLPLTCVK